jgi:hypothetical protein
MGRDTSRFTPQSSGFDTSSIPFVFSDGVLSFYTPSPFSSTSSDFASASPPASSASNASFLGVLPDTLRSGNALAHPIVETLAIWRPGDAGRSHIYAQTSGNTSLRIGESRSFERLDRLSMRYGALHGSIAPMSCPVLHVFIPLNVPTPTVIEDPVPIDSIVTISTTSRSHVRLVTNTYNRGTLTSQNETEMSEEPFHFGGARYSSPLPKHLFDNLCKAVDGPSSGETGMLDSIIVMQFVQKMDPAERSDERVILVLVCDFEANKGLLPIEVTVSQLYAGTLVPQDLLVPIFPIPPSPPEDSADVSDSALESISNSRRQRGSSRVLPKLSVAIPPPSSTKGRILLYTDSPGPMSTSDIAPRATPHTGVPQNVFPVTPYDQLIHTPLSPPEMPRHRVDSRAGFALTRTESAYSFTLSTTTPITAESPAFGLLDSSRFEGPRPTWPTPSGSYAPTVSSTSRHPHAASASNTQHAGTSTFSPLRMETDLGQPLAPPHPIASAPLLPPNSRPRSS